MNHWSLKKAFVPEAFNAVLINAFQISKIRLEKKKIVYVFCYLVPQNNYELPV